MLALLALFAPHADAAPIPGPDAEVLAYRHRPPPPPYRRGPPPPPPRHEAPPRTDASITLDAVDLARGEASLGVEIAVDPKDGLLLRGGLGIDDQGAMWHVGAEGRRYFLGDFRSGLFAGARLEGGQDHLFAPRDPVVAIGPTLGGKLTLPGFPLTLEASVGGDVLARPGFLALAPRAGIGLGFSF